MFKKTLMSSLALLTAVVLQGAAQGHSFAIVIDRDTYDHCQGAVARYKEAVEKDGLKVFIESAYWKSPEAVKEVLMRRHSDNALEGAVFIGKIPIPMVMHAQFMTSAYKMDERAHPLADVAVPSDRFYDDFDLKFNALPDAPQGLLHFYELAPDSLPYIECDIYTGRIMAQEGSGDPYEQISRYLDKATAAHYADNKLDEMVSFTGHGSYSGCVTAWEAEQKIIGEQFGDVFTHNNARYLRFSMSDYMKDNTIKELRRPELDFMAFHEHGDWYRMYISTKPQPAGPEESLRSYLERTAARDVEKARSSAEKWGLDTTWFAGYADPDRAVKDSLEDLHTGIILEEVNDIAPNAKFVIFDACYNADFRNPQFIAGKFIMSPGECVVCFGNSVNVLQDKAAFEFMGLLGRGARVGHWAQHTNILESHIIGDPTFHFAPYVAGDEVNTLLASDDEAQWQERLGDADPEICNMAMTRLFEAGVPGISDILFAQFKDSPYAIVRYRALALLQRLADDNYREALKLGVHDSYEFIRRVSVTRMGRCGDEDFLPYLIAAYVEDRNSARVVFNATQSLCCFDRAKATAAVEKWFEGKKFWHAAQYKSELLDIINEDDAAESLGRILDKDGSKNYRLLYIDFLRNRPYHQNTEKLLAVLADASEDVDVRTRLAESFAWYGLAYNKGEIISVCKSLLYNDSTPASMRSALVSAVTRLGSAK